MTRKVLLVVPEAPALQGRAEVAQREPARGGIRLGTLDNTKSNADHLLSFIVQGVQAALPVASVVRLRKENATVPARPEVLERLAAEADFVITAMGD
ncbi:MAG TPA: hypothetical protein VNK67_08435 [Burkholderiales bacterium]|nr:hypothetical protein [Burkholderiales bacterium]